MSPLAASLLVALTAVAGEAPAAPAAPAPSSAPSSAAPPTAASDATAPAGTPSTSSPAPSSTPAAAASPLGPAVAPVLDPVFDPVVDPAVEARDVARLRELESRVAVGVSLTDAELAELLRLLADAPSPRARALAAAVLPWLDPAVATPPLVRAVRDGDARVRVTAAQSLVALARRLTPELAPPALQAALGLLDDTSDEVACAGAELLAVLDAGGIRASLETRAATASDVRHACFARLAGLPVRAVFMPALPVEPAPSPSPPAVPPSTTPSPPAEPGPQWIALASTAGAGLLVGAALPAAILPSRDVLLYDDTATKLTREEVSVGTQLLGGVAGAALLGGGAWAAERLLGRLDDTEAITLAGASGAGATLGAGLGLMVGADGGGQALSLSLGTLAGVAAGAAVAWGGTTTDDDNALVLAAATHGAMATALGAFTALPVGADDILGATRTDFGLGAGFAGAGAFALAAVAASPFVDVSSARVAAITAGGLLGGGALTTVGFLVVPSDLNVRSRIACGIGLGGQVVGAVLAALLVPDAWLGDAAAATVEVAGRSVRLDVPRVTALPPLPGQGSSPLVAAAPLGVVVGGAF